MPKWTCEHCGGGFIRRGATKRPPRFCRPQCFYDWRAQEPIERFWRLVHITTGNNCWPWMGPLDQDGYGQFKIRGKMNRAHRWAYEQFIGSVSRELVMDHLCRNPACVRVDHLEPVTDRVNNLRGIGLAAIAAKKTHCINGHPFDTENTRYIHGERCCRQCSRDHCRAYRRRKKDTALQLAASFLLARLEATNG